MVARSLGTAVGFVRLVLYCVEEEDGMGGGLGFYKFTFIT